MAEEGGVANEAVEASIRVRSMVVTIGKGKVKVKAEVKVKVGVKEGVVAETGDQPPRLGILLPGQLRIPGGGRPDIRTRLLLGCAGSTGTSGRRRTSAWSHSPVHGKTTFKTGSLITSEGPASSAR